MGSVQLLLTTFLFAVLSTRPACADQLPSWTWRVWQTNLNYNNSHNWNIDRVPCDADTVIFQKSESVVLELPEGKTALRSLVLPSSVAIMLPKDGEVQFTGKKFTRTCQGEDAVFMQTRSSDWVDPRNWDQWNQATPDLERVPCASSAVRFSQGSTFRIVMPDFVKISALEMNGVLMDSHDWSEFAARDEGARQFHKADGDIAEVHITGHPCSSSEWCECGNEYLHSAICTADCPVPLCKQPVKPAGYCCPICGVYFWMNSKSGNKNRLTHHINNFLKDKEVVWHASKVQEFIQIVLVEKEEYSGEVPAVAEDLKTSLTSSNMGWIVKEFHASGHVWYPTTFGQVVLQFFQLMVFAALTIAAIFVFYSKDWTVLRFAPQEGRPFVFARFENQSGEVLVASEQENPSDDRPQAFNNPMYGATGQLQEQRSPTVENPVYAELEETYKKGPIEESIDLESTNFSQ